MKTELTPLLFLYYASNCAYTVAVLKEILDKVETKPEVQLGTQVTSDQSQVTADESPVTANESLVTADESQVTIADGVLLVTNEDTVEATVAHHELEDVVGTLADIVTSFIQSGTTQSSGVSGSLLQDPFFIDPIGQIGKLRQDLEGRGLVFEALENIPELKFVAKEEEI